MIGYLQFLNQEDFSDLCCEQIMAPLFGPKFEAQGSGLPNLALGSALSGPINVDIKFHCCKYWILKNNNALTKI